MWMLGPTAGGAGEWSGTLVLTQMELLWLLLCQPGSQAGEILPILATADMGAWHWKGKVNSTLATPGDSF
jgi:hypothetical protein